MAEKNWSVIWHQAMTRAFLKGKAFGRNKTAVFRVAMPASGEQLRLRFSNRFGDKPYEFGAVRAFAGDRSVAVTLNGKESFSIPTGGVTVQSP